MGTSTGIRRFLFGTGKKCGGTTCTGGYKGVRAVRLESVADGGWFEVLWNLECPVGLSQKRNMCAFQMKEIWSYLDGPPKKKELWSYVGREREKCFISQRTQHILSTVIWHQTYG